MNDKPKMIELGDHDELRYLLDHQDDLSVPALIRSGEGRIYADADEVRAWWDARP